MKAAFTCSYGLADRPLNMEMNFPHHQPFEASNAPVSLRKLDIDILRVLAFAPVTACSKRPVATPAGAQRQASLIALFAGHGRADAVAPGSFDPHFAKALGQHGATQQQGKIGVYHSASVNRKAARLLCCDDEIHTSQAF